MKFVPIVLTWTVFEATSAATLRTSMFALLEQTSRAARRASPSARSACEDKGQSADLPNEHRDHRPEKVVRAFDTTGKYGAKARRRTSGICRLRCGP